MTMMARKFEPTGDLAIRPEAVGLTWARAPQECEIKDGVAVVSISGPLEHKGGWWFDSYQSILGRIEGAMQSDDVASVLLKIDSPGGEVSGLQECVRRIRKMRADYDKPIVAYADDEAYSAAYALACSADEIYLPESGGLGSIGVLATVCDRTKMTAKLGLRIEVVRSGPLKAEGHPDIPLTDATLSRVQARVDQLADQFFSLVAEVRPISKKKIAALQGGLLNGQAAVDAGLADGVSSFDDVLSAMASDSEFDNTGNDTVELIPTDQSDGPTEGMISMKPFAALQKKADETLAAVIAAKTPAARRIAATAHAKAVAALTEAKVKKDYKKKTTTTEEESESDDGEAEAEEEDEEAEASDDPPPADDDDDKGDDEDDEEEEDAKAGKKATASLSAFVLSLTGKKSIGAARGVLQAMHEQAQRTDAVEAEVKALKATATATKKAGLISAALASGQLTPGQKAWAATQTCASLRAYIGATKPRSAPRPASIRGEEAPAEETSAEVDALGLTAAEHQICAMTGLKVEDYKKAKAGTAASALPKVN